ncbi:glycosyltransferase family 4 protein [Desulfosporosinus meridiei]|uniref:Glycosyltransferase n=1 Tax=Desulfosporosinus meridiei (strain ATCC BAA-275 / DSM 13257 / KCTC 12902 / NCIMB 13706 / S10) TaxID=768704 RepID=J7J4V1_DESMD|nr:glycosyltransferase family 4 protein [Desulfosporosinus meridiei]AFQ45976.1 glycosyltransferase [Desulfosporosinus meridiei DSM 13257]
MKSVTLLTQMFPPETGAASYRAFRLVDCLRKNKIDTTVITWFPHYPSRTLPERYKGKFFVEESEISAKIMRFKPIIGKKMFKRMISELWLGFFSFLTGLFSKKTDYVYASTPSVMLGYAGWFLAKLKGSYFILEIRDLIWNYAFVNKVGELNIVGKIVQKSMLKLASTSKIVVVSNEIQKSFLLENGIAEDSVFILYNGFMESELKPYTPKSANEYAFIVLYTGLVGIPQGLDVLIETAKLTKDYNIIYKIVGDGLEKEYLTQLVKRLQLTNVEFYPSVPKSKLSGFYLEADCLFAHLRGNNMYDSALPSKIMDYMVAGRPIVYAGRGEGKMIIEKADCGFVVEPDSPEAIAKVLINFLKEPNYEMGLKGYTFAVENFNSDRLFMKLLQMVKS